MLALFSGLMLQAAGSGGWRDPIFDQTPGQFLFSVICIVIVLAVVFWVCRKLGLFP